MSLNSKKDKGTGGVCRLCMEPKTLIKSHSIPNSIFKNMRKGNKTKHNGFVKSTVNDSSNIMLTDKTFDSYMLCMECDQKIGREYETIYLPILNGKNCKIKNKLKGMELSGIDIDKLRMFLITILWRAANSYDKFYSSVSETMSEYEKEFLREHIYADIDINKLMMTVVLERLTSRDNLFDDQSIKKLITNFGFFPADGTRPNQIFKIYYFTMSGFFIKFIFPGLDIKDNELGVLDPNKKEVFIPDLDISDNQMITDLLYRTLMKDKNGMTGTLLKKMMYNES